MFLKVTNTFHKNTILNQCIRLIEFLEYFSITRPVKEVKKSTIGLISIMGSIKYVIINKIYFKQITIRICISSH
jgi:hypothetical protein